MQFHIQVTIIIILAALRMWESRDLCPLFIELKFEQKILAGGRGVGTKVLKKKLNQILTNFYKGIFCQAGGGLLKKHFGPDSLCWEASFYWEAPTPLTRSWLLLKILSIYLSITLYGCFQTWFFLNRKNQRLLMYFLNRERMSLFFWGIRHFFIN